MKKLQKELIGRILNKMLERGIVQENDFIFKIYKEDLYIESINELERILTDLENNEFIVF